MKATRRVHLQDINGRSACQIEASHDRPVESTPNLSAVTCRRCLTFDGQPNCSVPECEKPNYRRGLCAKHDSRVRYTGTTERNDRQPTREQLIERFWSKVEKRGPDECWPWHGTIVRQYGQFHTPDGKVRAHRFAYELEVGPIEPGMTIDHVWERGCRRPDCCNPRHLEQVTNAENIRRSHAFNRRARAELHVVGSGRAADALDQFAETVVSDGQGELFA